MHSSCLNCQSNFRLKVLPPSRVIRETQLFQHLYHYCFSAVTALCFSISSSSVSALCFCICDPAFVFQRSCSSICVLASMFQHLLCVLHNQPISINDNLDHLRQLLCSSSVSALCFSIYVPAFVFQHLCFSICVLASMFQHLLCVLHNQPIAINDNLDHLHRLLCSSSVSALCFSICVPAFVFQHLCFSIYVLASMFQHLLCVLHNQPIAINDNLDHLRQLLCSISVSALCFSICVPAFVVQHLCFSICVSASVFQHLLCVLHKQSISLNDNLDHLLHLCSTLTICVIAAIAILPTISPFGIDGNMSFISPHLTSREKG
jgi:hypothetical protein